MPTPHDAIAATEARDANLLRNVLIKRVIYALDEDENPQDFVALDDDTGAMPVAIAWQEKLFWLDPDDSTSVHDGLSVLVTYDDYRYKTSELDLRIRSVLDKDTTSPPGSPAIGDAYLLPAAPTGDWSGYADYIAVYTARGWLFRAPVVGDQIYVEDEDTFYRYKASGAWSIGPGSRAFDSGSIPFSAAIGFGAKFTVENQTTNSPPSSAQGTTYIIGSSPTGAWSGHAGKIAIREASGSGTTYVIYSAVAGMRAYDKAQGRDYQFTGSAWQSATGRFYTKLTVFTASGTFTKDARCIQVKVSAVASGGPGGGVVDGGDVSFGSHFTVKGGGRGSGGSGGAGGTGGSGTATRFAGEAGKATAATVVPGRGGDAGLQFGTKGRGADDSTYGGGGGGEGGVKIIQASDLSTNETVTIGTAGQNNGYVLVEEFIEN